MYEHLNFYSLSDKGAHQTEKSAERERLDQFQYIALAAIEIINFMEWRKEATKIHFFLCYFYSEAAVFNVYPRNSENKKTLEHTHNSTRSFT
jgi:hypothetical protein